MAPQIELGLDAVLMQHPRGTMNESLSPAHAPAGNPDAPELSVVMPCLNEAESVAGCVHQALQFLTAQGISGEVVVADNGSSDGSQARAAAAGARVVEVQARGYGSALQGGIRAARGRWILMGDADGSYDFSALHGFVQALRGGADLVMGNRFRGGVRPGAMPFLNRFLGNPVLSGIGRLFFRSPAGDFHCGLRGFSRDAFVRMDLQTTGMEFASEMVVKATLMRMRIVEVPTVLSPAGRTRRPHLRPWRDGWRHLRFMLLYSPRWLFLLPGIALMAAGLVICGWLWPGPRRAGGVTLDVHTMLYAAALVLVGFQAVWFAVFAKIFAVTEGLMPPDPRLERAFRHVTLETGLVLGGGLLLGGMAGSLHAVSVWRDGAFGPLDPASMLRLIIPSVLALILGGQVVLASFFMSLLGLRRKRRPLEGP
jgi:hypothetical protein